MNKEKSVDESWKEQASQEKEVLNQDQNASAGQEATSGEASHQEQEFEINFLNYVTSLGFQAMIFLGEIPNPVSNKVEKNLDQAKFLIDTLAMLKDKTAGNLNEQERNLLESSVYELQLKYVQVLGSGNPELSEGS